MQLMRMLLWVVIIFIVWKVIRLISSTGGKRSDPQQRPLPPFSNVEDADYEDLTPGPSPPAEPEKKP
jgi:hypothetical protein